MKLKSFIQNFQSFSIRVYLILNDKKNDLTEDLSKLRSKFLYEYERKRHFYFKLEV